MKSAKLEDFLSSTDSVAKRSGPKDQIVMSSRVRLARNLRGFPFPGHAKKLERIRILEDVREACQGADAFQDGWDETMDRLTAHEKQLLVERHLISREHAAKGAGSGLLLDPSETMSLMINEEDHLRMQAIQPGLQISEVWRAVDAVDSALEGALEYAFSSELGYLTACPTNLGTGIRVSAMLHLPGLVLSDQINQVVQAVQKLGLVVRGLYGEGSDALGNVFQVSNQMTLGEREEEIVERLQKVLGQLIEHEENARELLMEKSPTKAMDQMGRAYGVLTNAHSIASKETMNLLSLMRLGADLGVFSGLSRTRIDELFIASQPAHLQSGREDKMSAETRDVHRADMLRESLKGVTRTESAPAAPSNAVDGA